MSTRATLPRFLTVGVIATLVNYALYRGLLHAGIGYGPAYVAGFLLGVAVGFALNHSWTYAGHGAGGGRVIGRYLGVYGVSLAMGYVLLAVLVRRWGIDPRVANLATIVQSTGINYLGTRFWVFAA